MKNKSFCRLASLSLYVLLLGGCSSAAADASDTVQQEQSQTASDQSTQSGDSQQSSTPNACDADSLACDAPVVPAENDFEEISFDDAIEFFKDGKSGILYFGFPDCPWCQEVVPILEAETQKAGVPVYYVRTRDDQKERLYTDEQKESIQPYLETYMSENDEGIMTLFVPVVVSVIDGQAVAGHVGTVDEHDAHERKMTEAEKAEVVRAIDVVVASASSGAD